MTVTPTVLFVDDEEHLRIAAAQTFDLADIDCLTFSRAEAALDHVARSAPGVLVTDVRMPQMDGVTLLHKALAIDPEFPVILITGHGDVDLAVRCLKDGAYDFLEKPTEPARLVDSVRRALDKRLLTLENRDLRRQVGATDVVEARITGRSDMVNALRDQVRSIAQTDADVLITGDTGTGKEVVARTIHRASERSEGPFVHVNCAALPEGLIESELFGHEVGAFAGAMRARFGKFEHARRGVLCLDEIDSLPMSLQAKLLHSIQSRTITRLGSNEPVDLDIRIVAIAKSGLERAVAERRFRDDLMYRLNVVTLHLPPLSDRREDIPRLFTTLLNEAAVRYKKPAPDVTGAYLSQLAEREWPGNVRELRNAADRFLLGFEGKVPQAETPVRSLPEQMAAHEKALIAAAISAHRGSLKETYQALGLSRKTLYEKMQKHGLSRSDFSGEK